ncbi:MAG TPA: TolC family protein [Sulfuricurvum sp.]|nr:MAG: hypothetical protein B7Y30_09790 [Campylobacterales bacterium 16-40-21]OZA02136.1 MAG: hypothetical protein B7X89_10595 [Sulfuricurvum sp. 17-40-25]HQS67700.1 TolC family protein [Sulfuricurvum sp.]HQT36919.1 TolC family protein [Sulfuricurvum sp.]
MKILLLLSAFVLSYAETFDTFLTHVVDKNPYLNASALMIDNARLEGKKLSRYDNPTIEMEASNFQTSYGYRMAFNQPVRVWGVGDDKEKIARSLSANAKASVTMVRSSFIKELSLLYTDFAQNQKLAELANEELQIAQSIKEVSKQRYANGSLSKALMLQSSVVYADAQANVMEYEKEKVKSYNALREYAGVTEEVIIESDSIFTRISQVNQSPNLVLLESQNDLKLAQTKLETRTIESIGVFGEYEKEPGQNIYRAGISIPIPMFNTKQEEKSIQELQLRQNTLLLKAQKNRIQARENLLLNEIDSLEHVLQKRQENLKNALELFKMYRDAYAIANVNLMEFYEIKNRRIATQKEMISVQSQINRSTIEYNYLQGAYNE